MKVKYHNQIYRMAQCFLLALFLAGCPATYIVPPEPVSGFPQGTKLNINVELYLSDELRNTKWERSSTGFTSEIFFGDVLSYNAEKMARELFTNVVVTNDKNKNSKKMTDGTLVLKVISINMPWVRGSWNNTVIKGIFEWTFKDSKGDIVWIDTVKGEGNSTGGTKVGPVSRRVKLLLEDIFQRSFQAISNSFEVREFVAVRQADTPLK